MKLRIPIVVLVLAGSLLWLSAAATAPDTPARAAASLPNMKVPIPSDYPGGMSNPRFHEDSRRFHQGIDTYLETMEADSAAMEASSMSQLLSSFGSILVSVAVGLGVVGAIHRRRLVSSPTAEVSPTA